MRMPNELLDEVFKHVFAGLEREPLRDRIRVYAPLSLVCRAWQRVAVTHAYASVVVDAAKDSDAIAFLDPVGGAGSHWLSLVNSVTLSASEPLIKAAPTGDQEEEDEEAEGDDSDAPPARPSPLLHGKADDETFTLPIVASLARILAKCSNLSTLIVDQHLESAMREITANHDPTAMWPKLTHLDLAWYNSFIDLLPVLARLSRLQTLTTLVLFLVTGHDDPRGTMTQELVNEHPVQPLEHLQRFWMCLFAEAPIGSNALLQLLSPHAPFQHVFWGGYTPSGMCKHLSCGTREIEELTFKYMLPTHNFGNQLLPQLLELGHRPVRRLTFNLAPEFQIFPPVTDILKNLPYSVRFSHATDMDGSRLSSRKRFPTGGADFAAIKARPTAAITVNDNGECEGSFQGKPLLQVGMFWVEEESEDDVHLPLFGRFGDPTLEGGVTEWMLLKMEFEEDGEEFDEEFSEEFSEEE